MEAFTLVDAMPFSQYSHIEGELVSLKSQLKSLESDYREFKDVNKKYTDQLIKVKVSHLGWRSRR